MGIEGIHILFEDDSDDAMLTQIRRLNDVAAALIVDHRRGLHTYGNMHRACPLCQRS